MKLYHQTYFDQALASDLSPVIIIPGLFGSTNNWRRFAKALAEHRKVIVIDQRNHGKSPHADDNSYFDLVADVLELLDDMQLDKASFCGHSMGGKTAMLFALLHPNRTDQLVVLDIAPVAYLHTHAPILQALQAIDLHSVGSRSEVEGLLESGVPDKKTRLFLMLNLTGKPGEYAWRLNVSALYENIDDIGGFPNDSLQGHVFEDNCLFIKGADSDYISERYHDSVFSYFPRASIDVVPEAGHWLHIDQQQAVLDKMLGFYRIS